MNKNLHVFKNNASEWVFAESPEDAVRVIEEATNRKYDAAVSGPFTQLPDDIEVTIAGEKRPDTPPIPAAANVLADTPRYQKYYIRMGDLAKARGRGIFGDSARVTE